LDKEKTTIIGYYNIGLGYIEQIYNEIKQKLGGSVHINCFALDERYHGLLQGLTDDGTRINLSDILLYKCLETIYTLREKYIGFTFITLCSTKEGYSLYRRNDFEDLEEDMNFSVEESDMECTLMYLPVELEELGTDADGSDLYDNGRT
jgi:hypothetical protein